jgi:hypothetical protein
LLKLIRAFLRAGVMEQAQRYQAKGHRWVVDLDLEKFLDPYP